MIVGQSNWHLFEMEFRVAQESFDKDRFLEDIKDVTNVESDFFGWAFGSETDPGKQHADIMLDFRPRRYIRGRIVYHRSDAKIGDHRPPYMETCASWLAGFIQQPTLMMRLDIMYCFEESYISTVSLPFPLLALASGRNLEGAMVTGVAIKLSDEQRITIDRKDDEIFLGLRMKKEMSLKDFKLDSALQELSPVVNKFIKETAVQQ